MVAQPEPVCHLVIPKDVQAPGTQTMTVVGVIQGTPEWRQARVGSLGASRVHDAVARTRNGWSASRAGALSDIVCERLTGLPVEAYITEAMRRGTALEPQARAAYAFQRDIDVELVGLVRHPSISGTHASPDGLVAGCGLVEIKCPATNAHLATLLTGTMPERYVTQCLWQLACTGRTWCDLVSYDDRLPEPLRLHVTRIERDDERMGELEAMIAEFLAEVDAMIERLPRVAGGAALITMAQMKGSLGDHTFTSCRRP
jgi:putative phage-type endonuclease